MSSALALVSLATAVTTIYPNDESEGAGFYSLVERTTSSTTGTRVCSFVDRGESQAYRNLAPFNNQKQLVNIFRRNTHDERAHHSHAHQEESDEKELFELNTNHRDIWSDLEQSFVERECDSVAKVSFLEDDGQELGPDSEMDFGRRVQDVFKIPQGTGEEVSLQEGDEVVITGEKPSHFFYGWQPDDSIWRNLDQTKLFPPHAYAISANWSTVVQTRTESALSSWATATLLLSAKNSLAT